MKNNCVLLACHTDTLKKYFTTLNNINEFKKFTKNIIIINSSDSVYSNNLKDDLEDFDYILDYIEIKNDKYLDFGKWVYALKNYEKFDYKIFDYIIFTNDSILIIEKLDNFFHYIENLPEDINIYGYNDSSQLGIYHYQSYLFLIKTRIMNKFLNHFQSKKHLIHNQESVIRHFELNLIQIDKKHDCFLKLANEWNSHKNIFWENDNLYENMLERNIFHLLKLKKIKDYINNFKYDIEKVCGDFNPEFYKNNYKDLNSLSDEELYNHYKGYGFKEGRNCKLDHYNVLPKVYEEKLNKIKLNELFNIPSTFDIYIYKSKNSSKKNLSNKEIFNYYDDHAREKDDIKIKNFNNIGLLNKTYIYYTKLFFNINVKLDNKFTYKKLLKFNNDLKNTGILKNIIKYFYRNDLIPNINLEHYNMEIEWIKRLHSNYKNADKDDIISFLHENKNNFEHLNDKYLEYYKEKYNLIHFDTEYVKHHYKYIHSINKSNIFYTFDTKIYKILNKRIPGLLKLSQEDTKDHYFTIGYKSNLPYKISDNFDPVIYKNLHYDEFKDMSNETLYEHYLHFGHHEKRNINLPLYFNVDVFKRIFKKYETDNHKLIYDYLQNYYSNKNTKEIFINFYKNNLNIFHELNLIPYNFNDKVYKLLNKDLKNLNNIHLRLHFVEYGFDEGRTYKLPENFNLNLYRKYNKDLEVLTDDELIIHYFEYGLAEKRDCNIPSNFRMKNYKKLNPDLKDLNQEELLEHYIMKGIDENRPYNIPLDFVPSVYKKLYKDLENLNDEQLILHYSKQGKNENRIYKLNSRFNADNYKKYYKDLVNLNEEDALYHYVNIGIKEGRVYELPKDFDLHNYRNLHFDLTFMNDNEVLEHFIYHGIAEKRQYIGYNKYFKKKIENENLVQIKQEVDTTENIDNLPSDFSTHGYKLFNPDLFYYDKDEFLIKHYLEKGMKENRLYKMPEDFSFDIYKKLNPDVENFSDSKILEHFKSKGISENRSYKFPVDFDFDFYKKVYLDNNDNYNNEKIKEFYLEKGIKKKHWIKVPDDFDINIYRKLNQDLETLDDTEILKQYVKVGHKTRIYK